MLAFIRKSERAVKSNNHISMLGFKPTLRKKITSKQIISKCDISISKSGREEMLVQSTCCYAVLYLVFLWVLVVFCKPS